MAEVRSRKHGMALTNDHAPHHTRRASQDTDPDATMEESKDGLEESEEAGSGDGDTEEEMADSVLEDMRNFEANFRGITKRYKLLNRIGEGTFSTVYKAEDLHYDQFNNDWDMEEKENEVLSPRSKKPRPHQRRPHFVAIKKIYVTSSPVRIMNELELLHDLRDCDSVCPLITAFRYQDQVIAVLPYFAHLDFRAYFRDMSIADMRSYFRSLLTGLSHVHRHGILHRDIKPTNFLYDLKRKRGVLVDFGLAERQDADSGICVCQLGSRERRRRIENSYHTQHGPIVGYPKEDQRPSRRANRAGTRGFRAPEVLFKCTSQTSKIDVWSVGIILLTILSRRFPFFHSADDIDAVIELTTVFGKQRMKACAMLHGQVYDINIPTVTENGFSLEKIILWSTNQPSKGPNGERLRVPADVASAVAFLESCLDLDPEKRYNADEALNDAFFSSVKEDDERDEIDPLAM